MREGRVATVQVVYAGAGKTTSLDPKDFVAVPVLPIHAVTPGEDASPVEITDLDQLKPEAVYFTDHFGKRSAFVVVHMTENSEIPKFAEPWFLLFNASIEIHAAMTPADLGAAGLDDLGKMWG